MSSERHSRALVLFNSILKEDISLVVFYLRQGADPSYVLPDGAAPIHVAVGIDDLILSENITQLLLEYGADPNVRSSEGLTPMHIAATYGRSENLALLMKHGGDPDIRDMEGQTVLDSTSCSLCSAVLKNHTQGSERKKVKDQHGVVVDISSHSSLTGLADENTDTGLTTHQNDYSHTSYTMKVRSRDTEPTSWTISTEYSETRNGRTPTKRNGGRSETWVIPVEDWTSKVDQRPRPKSEVFHFKESNGRLPNNHPLSHPFNSPKSLIKSGNLNKTYVLRSVSPVSDGEDTSEDSEPDSQCVTDEDTFVRPSQKTYCIDSSGDLTASSEDKSSDFEFDGAELPSVTVMSEKRASSGSDSSTVSDVKRTKAASFKNKNKPQPPTNYQDKGSEEMKDEEGGNFEVGSTFLISSDESQTEFQTVIHNPAQTKQHSIKGDSPTVRYRNSKPIQDDSLCSVTSSTFRPIIASTSIDSDGSEESCYVSATAPDPIQLGQHLAKLRLNTSSASTQSAGSQCSCHARAEETIITDEEDGFSLVEVHLIPEECVCSTPSPDCAHPLVKAISPHCFANSSADSTLLYDWKDGLTDKETESEGERVESVPREVAALTDCQLRSNLLDLGDNPGPILPSTRHQYEMRLVRLRKDPTQIKLSSHKDQEFLPELAKALEGNLDLSSVHGLEEQMNKVFGNADPTKHWREGTKKASFIYLLLDPRVTQNLPLRSKHMSHEEGFKAFVRAVFYVGKGKSARPYCHFKEAIKHYSLSQQEPGPKVQQIHDIWQAGLGVVSLHIFQNTIPVEAFTREACIIEAFGLSRLTNKCKGNVYGPATRWSKKELRTVGVRLLKKAYHILLFEGERQIKPHDVKTK